MFKTIKKNIKKITQKKIVRNFDDFLLNKKGKALLYYKIGPLINKRLSDNYKHSNNWEILEICKILNEHGFVVDVIDRGISDKFLPENVYDIFIGNASGGSGKHYLKYAKKSSKAKKIFYATGASPEIRDSNNKKRYDYFKERHGFDMPILRRTNLLDFKESIKISDAIFNIGEIDQFAADSYKKFGIPIFSILPSTSPNLIFNKDETKYKKKNCFLYFGGNGGVHKGLDLVIEVFSELPDLELYICTPHEEEFYNFYKDILENSKNINYVGFIDVGSEKFKEITRKCGFCILPSCAEGCATSVCTCMRRGLVPVLTREAGVNTGDFGYIFPEADIDKIKDVLQRTQEIKREDFEERIIKSYEDSKKYTQDSFRKTFSIAIEKVLGL